jgi:hypothetical protein
MAQSLPEADMETMRNSKFESRDESKAGIVETEGDEPDNLLGK